MRTIPSRRARRAPAIVAAILSMMIGIRGQAAGSISELAVDEAAFDRWRSLIVPTAEESAWREIPWRAALWDAVIEARAKELPVLLWAMNGHPLACT